MAVPAALKVMSNMGTKWGGRPSRSILNSGIFQIYSMVSDNRNWRRGDNAWPHEDDVKAQEKGCRLEDVLDFSRHKDIRTLQKYLKRSGKTQGKFSGFALDALSDQKEEDEECPSE